MGITEPTGSPIFILGILFRSGTNYLQDLLRLHPECTTREPPIWEDGVLYHARPLIEYCQRVFSYWRKVWGVPGDEERLLYECLGDGLRRVLQKGGGGKRVVTKTPTVENSDFFFDFFPNSPLIVIVRDGRAVVESAVCSFPMTFEATARRWAANARRIDRLLETQARVGRQRWFLVKYEDLVKDVRAEITKILLFLGLDKGVYDFEAAERLPVRGSCNYRGVEVRGGPVHWDPVPKGADFQPLLRFAHWSKARHQRFNWIAGRELELFGYEPQFTRVGLGTRLRNRWEDVAWLARRALRGNGAANFLPQA